MTPTSTYVDGYTCIKPAMIATLYLGPKYPPPNRKPLMCQNGGYDGMCAYMPIVLYKSKISIFETG